MRSSQEKYLDNTPIVQKHGSREATAETEINNDKDSAQDFCKVQLGAATDWENTEKSVRSKEAWETEQIKQQNLDVLQWHRGLSVG